MDLNLTVTNLQPWRLPTSLVCPSADGERRGATLDKRELRVAVRARTNGGYTYQIFTIESEPKTLLSAKRGRSYGSPAEAAQAGFEAVATFHCINHDLI